MTLLACVPGRLLGREFLAVRLKVTDPTDQHPLLEALGHLSEQITRDVTYAVENRFLWIKQVPCVRISFHQRWDYCGALHLKESTGVGDSNAVVGRYWKF